MGPSQLKLFSLATFAFNGVTTLLSSFGIFMDGQSNQNARYIKNASKDFMKFCLFTFEAKGYTCDRVWKRATDMDIVFYAIRIDVVLSMVLFLIGVYNTFFKLFSSKTPKLIHVIFFFKLVVLFAFMNCVLTGENDMFEELFVRAFFSSDNTISPEEVTYYAFQFEALMLPILSFVVTAVAWLILLAVQFVASSFLPRYVLAEPFDEEYESDIELKDMPASSNSDGGNERKTEEAAF